MSQPITNSHRDTKYGVRHALLHSCLLLVSLTSTYFMPISSLAHNCEPIYSTEEKINDHKYQVHRTRVNAPPDVVWSVLTDYSSAPQIFSKVLKCSIVQDLGDEKAISFKVKTLRDLVTLEYVLNIHEHYPTRIDWSRKSGAFKINEGYWNIEGIDGGKASMVTYAKFVDAGPLTNFLVTKELKYDMPIILTQVKLFAENMLQNNANPTLVIHPRNTGQKASLNEELHVVAKRSITEPDRGPQNLAARK